MHRSTPFTIPTALVILASLGLPACGPSEADEANMKEKMELETKRAKLLLADRADCKKLGKDLADFKSGKDGQRLKELDPWWGALGKRAKDKLIEAHKQDWDMQTTAIAMGGMSCIEEFKANF